MIKEYKFVDDDVDTKYKIIEALQYDGSNLSELINFMYNYIRESADGNIIEVQLPEGYWITLNRLDYVVKFTDDTFVPVHPAIFRWCYKEI